MTVVAWRKNACLISVRACANSAVCGHLNTLYSLFHSITQHCSHLAAVIFMHPYRTTVVACFLRNSFVPLHAASWVTLNKSVFLPRARSRISRTTRAHVQDARLVVSVCVYNRPPPASAASPASCRFYNCALSLLGFLLVLLLLLLPPLLRPTSTKARKCRRSLNYVQITSGAPN